MKECCKNCGENIRAKSKAKKGIGYFLYGMIAAIIVITIISLASESF
jgi:predicted nucleic acid-binding Zn ribbon protein